MDNGNLFCSGLSLTFPLIQERVDESLLSQWEVNGFGVTEYEVRNGQHQDSHQPVGQKPTSPWPQDWANLGLPRHNELEYQ